MHTRGTRMSAIPILVILATAAVLSLGLVAAGPARAGDWMQVSCVNPNGSAAPNAGWAGSSAGGVPVNSDNDVNCSPGSPMTATVLASGPSSDGSESLTYTPPAGSTVTGGSLQVSLSADGHSSASPNDASGAASVLAPDPELHPADELVACAYWSGGCWNLQGSPFQTSDDWSGTVDVPSNVGGTVTVIAACATLPSGGSCDSGGNGSVWAQATMSRADLLLSSSASPAGSGFSGSALQPGVSGTAHLVFTATDPGGPGVYAVSAAIDGHVVFAGTPNTNGGACVPVGTDASSGALMFDSQQPCPTTDAVDLAIPTAGLPDGNHELTVDVVDAAQNSSTVLDQEITTLNPTITPAPKGRRAVHARFVLSWRWIGTRTRLLDLASRRLPRGGHVAVSCRGHGCPRLRVKRVPARRWAKLRRELKGALFTTGDHVELTVTAPHRRAERIEITIRNDEKPAARLR